MGEMVIEQLQFGHRTFQRGERRWTLLPRNMTAIESSTPAPHASDSPRSGRAACHMTTSPGWWRSLPPPMSIPTTRAGGHYAPALSQHALHFSGG